MKRIVTLLLLGFLCAASANAAVIINTCTSTYQISGYQIQVSGWDSVTITTDNSPSLVITKLVKNLRTGIESNDFVNALSNDTVEFTIIWRNYGGAADTITLVDYLPDGLTYETNSLSDTEGYCDTTTYGTATYMPNAGKGVIDYMTNAVAGANPGPSGNGVIRFRVKVD